jgi:tRNA U54 and U55 pseudouridine synthase Pus10
VTERISEANEKKQKLNPCVICHGLFESVEEIIQRVKNDEALKKYEEIETFLSSFSLPVLLELTQLQMWLALLEKFPENFTKGMQRELN